MLHVIKLSYNCIYICTYTCLYLIYLFAFTAFSWGKGLDLVIVHLFWFLAELVDQLM